MKEKYRKKIWLCFVVLMIFLAGCGSTFSTPTVRSPVSPLPTIEVTNISVLSPVAIPTATSTKESTQPLPNIEQAHIDDINMMDETSGWAWYTDQANVSYLLHTSDRGQTWQNVTPQENLKTYLQRYSHYEVDAQTAWILLEGEKLIRTLDGGQTWDVINQNVRDKLAWPYPDWYTLRFTDANHGWLRGDVTAAGSRVFFYETLDGGVTWHPADFETLPGSYRHENAKNEIAFWVDTDVIYYDLERFIIAPGDQEGTLEMFVSTNWGNSWNTVELPSSTPSTQLFNLYDRKIHSPVFFDSQNGVLAVTIRDANANITQLSVYGTSDGGRLWSFLGGPLILKDTIVEPGSEVLFVSIHDAILLCGTNLCVTHDSGNSWQTLDYGLSIPADKQTTSFHLDFVNPNIGWLLVNLYDDQYSWLGFHLLITTDGGITWSEISPIIKS